MGTTLAIQHDCSNLGVTIVMFLLLEAVDGCFIQTVELMLARKWSEVGTEVK